MAMASANPGFPTLVRTLRPRHWQLGAGQAALVMEQFTAEDFNQVVDDRTDVHVNSTDGRFHLG